MKRTGKRLVMLMTVLFLLIMGTGATIAWGRVTVPTKGEQYRYNFNTKKWEKTGRSFRATFSSNGKLKKVTYNYGSEIISTTYTWKGDYLKKVKFSDSESTSYTTTYTYKNGKPSKVKGSDYTITYKWKGNKGKSTRKDGDSTIKRTLTLKNGRESKNKSTTSKDQTTYSYYQRGLRKSYTQKYGSYKNTITFGRNGFKIKDSGNSWTVTYNWKKKSVTITSKDHGKVFSKTKWKFSKTQSVSRAWNCDAYGMSVTIDV